MPDGEPTLDVHLGQEIELLRPLGFPIAVITNASLIWRQDVGEDLMGADWVSLKVDAVEEAVWRRISRSHRSLALASILEEASEFARVYEGELVTETMLVAGVNDGEAHLEAVAGFLASLQPAASYVFVPPVPRLRNGYASPTRQSSISPIGSWASGSSAWNTWSATKGAPLPSPAMWRKTC